MSRWWIGGAALLILAGTGCASSTSEGPESSASTSPGGSVSPVAPSAPSVPLDPRLDWWREARFGLFIHWGLYAIPAGEWNGETQHAEWIRTTARIPLETYDDFVERFDPVRFDADTWVRAAKGAGMRYIVVTTKHHDGFCLFDSAHTDFDVMSTPFRRDVMRELADACRRHGLRIGWYHSILDWHHPDYLPRREWETDRSAEGADLGRYVEHLHRQVTELLTKYGPIGVMWFDGEWESSWDHARGVALYDLCRSLQPDVIVNNRVDVGRSGMAGLTREGEFRGDFGTPEQEVPPSGLPGVDWESCVTMNEHWGYNRADAQWKSSRELIHLLVDVASKGGNLLLNVGPRADGTFPAESLERLAAIGAWMERNGEAIHGTAASPIPPPSWGRCTMRRSGDRTRLYLHVFDWPGRALVVPGLANAGVRARLLADPAVELSAASGVGHVVVRLPESAPDPDCTVILLEIDGEPVVDLPPSIAAPAEIFVGEGIVSIDAARADHEIRYTVDGEDPSEESPLYAGPLRLTESTVVRARGFRGGAPVTGIAERRLTRVEPSPAIEPESAEPGLRLGLYAGRWDALPDFAALAPASVATAERIGLVGGAGAELHGARFEGWITLPADALWEFVLESDDGARLRIGDKLVVDNDGLHGPSAARGIAALAAGAHPIVVEYFNKTGGAALSLAIARAGEAAAPVPGGWLSH